METDRFRFSMGYVDSSDRFELELLVDRKFHISKTIASFYLLDGKATIEFECGTMLWSDFRERVDRFVEQELLDRDSALDET